MPHEGTELSMIPDVWNRCRCAEGVWPKGMIQMKLTLSVQGIADNQAETFRNTTR